jgi:hypothetical protein
MNYLIAFFYASLFCFTPLVAMEMEPKEEEQKRSAVPTLLDITARYVAANFCNPMRDEAEALSFITGDNAKYLGHKTDTNIVQGLARDAAERLEEIFPVIPAQLQEKKEISLAQNIPKKIYSLDKKWYARESLGLGPGITMGKVQSFTEFKNISIPLLPGYTECASILPRAISQDNQICLVEVTYIKNEKYAYHHVLGVDYNKANILYHYPLYDVRTSKDRSIFLGKNNKKIIAYFLSDGVERYKLAIPGCDYKSKIVLSKDNEHVLASTKNKLYVCNGLTGNLIRTLSVENDIKNYCLSDDERSVAVLETNAISVSNIHSGNTICSIKDDNCKDTGLKGFYDNDRFVLTEISKGYADFSLWDKGENSGVYLWDTVKQQLVAKKKLAETSCDNCGKVFIYPHIAKTLTLKELISLLALEKKWKAGELNQNFLATIKESKCEWLKDLANTRYSRPVPQKLTSQEKSEQKERCPVM